MTRARRTLLPIVAAVTILGCEGSLVLEPGEPGAPPSTPTAPQIFLDGGGSGGGDAGAPAPLPPSAPADAGSPSQDAGSPPPAPPPAPPPTEGCGTPIEQAVIAAANASRAETGAGPVTCDPLMTRAARLHSQDMCDQGYFSHTSLDGRSPFDRMRDEGVSFGAAGENIAMGQTSAAQVHTSWMNSSGHRMNILSGSFRRIGVGYVECGGRPYWTQNFAD